MIMLTRRDNHTIFLNPDLIETMEETPDTVITLTNGHRHLVCESALSVIARIVDFKAAIIRMASSPPPGAEASSRAGSQLDRDADETLPTTMLNNPKIADK